jgi:hypothetical protein
MDILSNEELRKKKERVRERGKEEHRKRYCKIS